MDGPGQYIVPHAHVQPAAQPQREGEVWAEVSRVPSRSASAQRRRAENAATTVQRIQRGRS
eukprot:COSAG01_NODE_43982_length_424_cov_0.443077_1_plen_60_part_01